MGAKCTRWPAGKFFDKSTTDVCWFNHYGDPESPRLRMANQKDKQRWKSGAAWTKKDWAQWFKLSASEQKDCVKGKGAKGGDKGKGPKGKKGDGKGNKGKGPKGANEDNKTDTEKDDDD